MHACSECLFVFFSTTVYYVQTMIGSADQSDHVESGRLSQLPLPHVADCTVRRIRQKISKMIVEDDSRRRLTKGGGVLIQTISIINLAETTSWLAGPSVRLANQYFFDHPNTLQYFFSPLNLLVWFDFSGFV